MIIVSDTSPISNLLLINQIDLLRQIFETVIIPEGVLFELQASRSFDISTFLKNDWVRVEQFSDRTTVEVFLQTLDLGESEAISLAQTLNADLLIDERKGREVALRLGLKTTGVVGVLIIAKKLGLLAEIKPLLDDLEQKAGFWMPKSLRVQALILANELT